MPAGGISGLLKSKAKAAKKVVTEAELHAKPDITIDDVTALEVPTESYLCKPSDNIYGVEFVAFKLRDLDRNVTLFEVAKPEGVEFEDGKDDLEDPTGRFVPYEFPPEFLQLRNVGATVTFVVGDKPVNNFTMVERHFFKGKLLKSFSFNFPFCIPGSSNTCEQIYEFPALTKAEVQDMVESPGETKSDSFYFVDGKLIMHNKAEYSYDAGIGDSDDSDIEAEEAQAPTRQSCTLLPSQHHDHLMHHTPAGAVLPPPAVDHPPMAIARPRHSQALTCSG
eukprot:CAMPEP_0182920564 /NCGR_PEP_ID=MMETSP0105_2-20130417/3556_1 /TAXON_ID=81532 ORGANISM="Acanthoeca-like sp., Strain 10tr" /NCGR_SAMPLE_ID=MMETSP0105_2 /ASSEMBLY_ACC=CAM_ASM_000205 /LENGTH=278 /DNA_ID=CAMNT_0025057981 /DNA_START=69 /DNA_END=906 /DNA_ORIENTATION=-